jgi:hypothetical protein
MAKVPFVAEPAGIIRSRRISTLSSFPPPLMAASSVRKS